MADQNILGGRALDAALQSLGVKVEKNILRAALRAGAKEFEGAIKTNMPVKTGALKRSVRVSTRSKGGKVTASVKVGGKRAPHAALVEFGTKAHKISPKRGKALRLGSNVIAEVDHPGARARPFTRPAFDTKGGAAVQAVAAKIRSRLTAEGINVPAPE